MTWEPLIRAALGPDLVLVAYAMNDDAVSPAVFIDREIVRFEYALPGERDADPAAGPGALAQTWGSLFLRSSFARYLTYAALRVRMSGRGQDEAQTPLGSASASMRDLAAIRDAAAAITGSLAKAFPDDAPQGPAVGVSRAGALRGDAPVALRRGPGGGGRAAARPTTPSGLTTSVTRWCSSTSRTAGRSTPTRSTRSAG